MEAESPRGAHHIVCDTFLPGPVSLEKERTGSWPRTSGQIQGVRQAKCPSGIQRPPSQKRKAEHPPSRLCSKFPRAGRMGVGVRAILQLRSCSLGLVSVSASLSRTGTQSHLPHSTGQAGHRASQDSRDGETDSTS